MLAGLKIRPNRDGISLTVFVRDYQIIWLLFDVEKVILPVMSWEEHLNLSRRERLNYFEPAADSMTPSSSSAARKFTQRSRATPATAVGKWPSTRPRSAAPCNVVAAG